eukprot:6458609-Amphidinium_carterae.1
MMNVGGHLGMRFWLNPHGQAVSAARDITIVGASQHVQDVHVTIRATDLPRCACRPDGPSSSRDHHSVLLPQVSAENEFAATPTRGLAIGAFTTRGRGITVASYERSPLVDAIHALAKSRPPGLRMPYLAAAITRGPVGLHVDKNYGISMTTSLGEFVGGFLSIQGIAHNPSGHWIVFDPSAPHEVTPLEWGSRTSITLYSPRYPGKVLHCFDELAQLGFPVAAWQRMVQWHRVIPASMWPGKDQSVTAELALSSAAMAVQNVDSCLQPSCPSLVTPTQCSHSNARLSSCQMVQLHPPPVVAHGRGATDITEDDSRQPSIQSASDESPLSRVLGVRVVLGRNKNIVAGQMDLSHHTRTEGAGSQGKRVSSDLSSPPNQEVWQPEWQLLAMQRLSSSLEVGPDSGQMGHHSKQDARSSDFKPFDINSTVRCQRVGKTRRSDGCLEHRMRRPKRLLNVNKQLLGHLKKTLSAMQVLRVTCDRLETGTPDLECDLGCVMNPAGAGGEHACLPVFVQPDVTEVSWRELLDMADHDMGARSFWEPPENSRVHQQISRLVPWDLSKVQVNRQPKVHRH